jgi:hypothetical protein
MYDRHDLLIRVQENLVNGDFPRIEDLITTQLVTADGDAAYRVQLERALRLAVVGRHIVQLDAEDFPVADHCPELPDETRRLLRQATAHRSDGAQGGQLASLNAASSVLLEVLQLHYGGGQFDRVVGILHLLGEYLPLLAWESVLGNAGEPSTVRDRILRGNRDWVRRHHPCPRGQKPYVIREAIARLATASRGERDALWQNYFKERRSSVADLLESCALCARDDLGGTKAVPGAPCGIEPQPDESADLPVRMASIRVFKRSEPIRQRHQSPHGHAFSVPSQDEFDAAWASATSAVLESPEFPLTAEQFDDGFVLPGLPSLIQYWGSLTHRPNPSDTVLQVGTAIQNHLDAERVPEAPENARTDTRHD